MHHFLKSIRRPFGVLASTLILVSAVHADPTENTTQTLNRTVQSLDIHADFSKNIFKKVPYQSNFDVQVPYQADEDDTVDVPYDETVPYTDTETETTQENVCHDRTTYEQECHGENRCQTVAGDQICHDERLCSRSPGDDVCNDVQECGTNAHNEPICKTRRECNRGPDRENCSNERRCEQGPSRQDCHTENICRNVPRTRQECGYESVSHTHDVTKYRTETRYRQETRTRTVTKYRTETKCCETRYRDEFDHQAQLPVLIRFPAEATLDGTETESFVVTMISESEIKVEMKDTLYGYTVKSQTIDAGTAVVTMQLVPKFQGPELADKTVSALKLNIKETGAAQVTFTDAGLKPRVNTTYEVTITDQATKAVVADEKFVPEQSAQVAKALTQPLTFSSAYLVHLTVAREGVVLAAPVQFAKDLVRPKGKVDPKAPLDSADFDEATVGQLQLKGLGAAAQLLIADSAPLTTGVATQYIVSIDYVGGVTGVQLKTLAQVAMDQSKVKVVKGVVTLSLKDQLKITAADLEKLIVPDSQLFIEVQVIRQGQRLEGGQPFAIRRELTAVLSK